MLAIRTWVTTAQHHCARLIVFPCVVFFTTTVFTATVLAAQPPKAAIATAHPLATTAGIEMLDAGGNAFDAAVAVAAALAVVEPYASGLGGGGFFLLHDEHSNRDVVIDARETAPLAAVPEMFQNNKGEVVRDWTTNGPLTAGIPGLPAALVHIAARHGQLPLAESLKPAIRLARAGFPVDERYRHMARQRLDALRRFANSSSTFLTKGDVPALGTLIRQPDLAASLEHLVNEGHDGFYAGKFAAQLINGVADAGGIWTLEDLAKYRIIERAPLSANYRGARIVTVPPPSAGGVALITMLNMLEAASYGAATPPARNHLVVESMRRAFRDRALYLGDPDFVSVPVARLLSITHARKLIADIDTSRATPSAALGAAAILPSSGDHTTHFSILDRNGNHVAATLSINLAFGSGFMIPGTGILLNNEMDDFSAAPGVANAWGLIGSNANAIAPGKRPLSSMTPTFVEYNNRIAILGSPGGSRIPGMVLTTLLSLFDAQDVQTALAAPRFHHQYLPDVIEAEPEFFGNDAARKLRARGHVITSTGRNYGNVQIVLWDKTDGWVTATSDPRGGGSAQTK